MSGNPPIGKGGGTFDLPTEVKPTLRMLLGVVAKTNTPCVSLVRNARGSEAPGVIVLMVGGNRKRFARALRKIADRLPVVPGRHGLSFDYDTPLEQVFTWLEADGHTHFHGKYEIAGVEMELAGFVGLEPCRLVARALNARGCPTSLQEPGGLS